MNSTSPLPYQSNSGPMRSLGSAMNPSSDLDAWVTTLPIPLAVDRSDQIMQLVATVGSPGGRRLRGDQLAPGLPMSALAEHNSGHDGTGTRVGS